MMKDREQRISAIRRIISERRVESQEELKELMEQNGYEVTQATLSRDLKQLRVGKISDGGDGYHYALRNDRVTAPENGEYVRDIVGGWISIDFSGNLGVVKTSAGHANSVALALDNLVFPEILGTVAGDDTIIIVLAETATKESFLDRLTDKVPDIEIPRNHASRSFLR